MHVAHAPAFLFHQITIYDMDTILNWRYWLMGALFYVGLFAIFVNPPDELLWWQTKAVAAASFYALALCARRWEHLLFPHNGSEET